MGDTPKKGLWLIRTHYRMRVISLALVFVASCFQLAGKDYGPLTWGYLIALLLLYPHVHFWFASRSKAPVPFAMRSLVLDAVLLGTYCASVGFSDWLSFSVVLGALSNNAANKGWRSIASTLLALVGGAVIGVAVVGWHFAPDTVWQATLVCMVGLVGYLLAVGNFGYTRNAQLRLTREDLRTREAELLQANQKLQATLLEIDSLRRGLAEQANRDPLTNIFNRRYLDSTLQREIARCAREGKPLSLIMLDIDHFKKFNDHYGHLAGDECLKAVSHALQTSARRAGDLAARYGGEEFTLVLPDTDGVQARRMAEALRVAIQELGIAHDGSPNGVVTVSIGLAVTTGLERASAERLIRAADEALYYAKWGGRNRVHAAPDVAADAGPVGYAPQDMVELVWLSAYESGHAEIDAQHAQLFEQVNQVCAAIRAQQPRSAVAAQVDNLIRHVAEHFECEERALAAVGFPGLQEHARLHQHLMERAVDLIGRYRNTNAPIGELLHYLAQDLVAKHILGADRKAQLEVGYLGH